MYDGYLSRYFIGIAFDCAIKHVKRRCTFVWRGVSTLLNINIHNGDFYKFNMHHECLDQMPCYRRSRAGDCSCARERIALNILISR